MNTQATWSEAELSDAELSEVSAGEIAITKHIDKSSPSLFLTSSGCPGFEYWFQQLMF
jgi:type VI protein secretion system component Hcp